MKGYPNTKIVNLDALTYALGGNNEVKNIDIVHQLIEQVDQALGRSSGYSQPLITFVTDRLGHDFRYAIETTKAQSTLGWKPKTGFQEGLAQTISFYLSKFRE